MGRIKTNVLVNNIRECWTLFDTGARNTYVVEEVASLLPVFEIDRPESVALGGKIHKVVKECRLTCLIEGFPIHGHARVLEEIGLDEEGKRLEILIGALTMQEWGIILIPEQERIDMSHYPKEFVEF